MAKNKQTGEDVEVADYGSLGIYERIHKVMGEVDFVGKEKKEGMSYSIVSHDAVTALVRPILHKWGVVYHPVELTSRQDGNRTETVLTVRFVCADKRDDFFDVPSLGYGIDSQDKGPGKSISYAVKYALLKTLGLETGDDPDLDQKTEHVSAKSPARPASPSAPSRPATTGLAPNRPGSAPVRTAPAADEINIDDIPF